MSSVGDAFHEILIFLTWLVETFIFEGSCGKAFVLAVITFYKKNIGKFPK